METFKIINKEKLGGFHSIEIIRKSDILSCPHILNNSNISEFKYKKGYDSEIEIMPVGESIIISSPVKKKPSGLEFSFKSKFEVLHPTAKIDDVFTAYTHGKVVVKGNKYDGTSILYGSFHFPLQLIYETKHSKKIETPTEMVVSISAKIPQKPVFMPNW